MDVGHHATGGDGHMAEKLVELFVVTDGKDKVARRDSLLLVVSARVARELEYFRDHVLEYCSSPKRAGKGVV